MRTPADNRFLNTVRKTANQVSRLERNVQPQLVQWYPYSLGDFSFNDDNYLNVESYLLPRISAGDRFRFVYEDGGQQTAYMAVSKNRLDDGFQGIFLTAGDDYVLTAANFSNMVSISTSKIASPQGYPTLFNIDASISASDGVLTENFSRFSINPSGFADLSAWIKFTANATTGALVVFYLDSLVVGSGFDSNQTVYSFPGDTHLFVNITTTSPIGGGAEVKALVVTRTDGASFVDGTTYGIYGVFRIYL